jgi:hypothetical protein
MPSSREEFSPARYLRSVLVLIAGSLEKMDSPGSKNRWETLQRSKKI